MFHVTRPVRCSKPLDLAWHHEHRHRGSVLHWSTSYEQATFTTTSASIFVTNHLQGHLLPNLLAGWQSRAFFEAVQFHSNISCVDASLMVVQVVWWLSLMKTSELERSRCPSLYPCPGHGSAPVNRCIVCCGHKELNGSIMASDFFDYMATSSERWHGRNAMVATRFM